MSCVEFDPNRSVTVVIAGLASDAEQHEVIEILETMYDKNGGYKRYKARFDNKLLTIQMAPVADVDAFSRRINFGTVTEVTGRTIKVTYVKSPTMLHI
jgi:hypothetical protein